MTNPRISQNEHRPSIKNKENQFIDFWLLIKTRTRRLWVYVRDDRNAGSTIPAAVWFSDSPDPKKLLPQRYLAEYSGILQSDAYARYYTRYERGRLIEATCMAHARRKIHDVHVRHPTTVTTETLRGSEGRSCDNILKRQFDAERPNEKWVTDFTEFKVNGRKLYLSPIMDLYNGEIVAYNLAARPLPSMVNTMLIDALKLLTLRRASKAGNIRCHDGRVG